MSLVFKESSPLTIGVELELQLIDLQTYNLAEKAEELLNRLKKVPDMSGTFKPEITRSMIEVNSSVHSDLNALQDELINLHATLKHHADKLQVAICGGGTHPFQKWKERKIFPSNRFENISQMYGYLAKFITVFGQHIHIGCRNGDDALKLTHAFAAYVPHLITLSASSPFDHGIDSEFDCSRLNIFKVMPTSGTAPKILTWANFEDYCNRLIDLQVISSIKDLHWDIRPQPEFGTVEIRVCDTPLQVHTSVKVAAYAQMLAAYLLDNHTSQELDDPYLVYGYNKFQATKFGFTGEIINPSNGAKISIRDDILATVEKLKPYAKKLNTEAYLEMIANDAQNLENDAKWLRKVHSEKKSLPEVMRDQVQLWNVV